jgi:hypothetical protein
VYEILKLRVLVSVQICVLNTLALTSISTTLPTARIDPLGAFVQSAFLECLSYGMNRTLHRDLVLAGENRFSVPGCILGINSGPAIRQPMQCHCTGSESQKRDDIVALLKMLSIKAEWAHWRLLHDRAEAPAGMISFSTQVSCSKCLWGHPESSLIITCAIERTWSHTVPKTRAASHGDVQKPGSFECACMKVNRVRSDGAERRRGHQFGLVVDRDMAMLVP